MTYLTLPLYFQLRWTTSIPMRSHVFQESALPRPGTTEAIESGCTCRFIGHVSNTDELEPAGMLMIPDANCPLHGTAAQRDLAE